MNETQKAVADYLESINVKFSTIYNGKTKKEDWPCFMWRIKLSGHSSIETSYFMGLGHTTKPKQSWLEPKPVSPCAADVIYSLILDSSAADQSFNDWCADYGYDNDSISAFNTYQACCNSAQELKAVFTREQIETLRTMLENY